MKGTESQDSFPGSTTSTTVFGDRVRSGPSTGSVDDLGRRTKPVYRGNGRTTHRRVNPGHGHRSTTYPSVGESNRGRHPCGFCEPSLIRNIWKGAPSSSVSLRVDDRTGVMVRGTSSVECSPCPDGVSREVGSNHHGKKKEKPLPGLLLVYFLISCPFHSYSPPLSVSGVIIEKFFNIYQEVSSY